jgi:hypothetical protein
LRGGIPRARYLKRNVIDNSSRKGGEGRGGEKEGGLPGAGGRGKRDCMHYKQVKQI